VTRRTAPRPIAAALAELAAETIPAGPLARVQASWRELAGPVVAAEAEPVAERSGKLTIACRSAVWAQELELLAGELLERLNGALGTPQEPRPIVALRLVVTDS